MTFRLRQKLLMVACVVLIVMGTASSSQAGLIPWLVDSLFGPSCSPYASRGYNPGYQPYGSANCYVPRVSTPPCYATSYATAPRYTQTCYPRRFLFPPLLPALFGGCRQPCAPSAGYRLGGCPPYGYGGCPPYGYGGCPVTLPAQPTAAKGDGWSKTQPRTFVPDSSAKTADKVDTKTFRPPTDVDPGEVIPQVEKPATVIPAGAEKKKPAVEPVEKPEVEKTPAAKPGAAANPAAALLRGEQGIAWRVVPRQKRLARVSLSRRLPNVVVRRRAVTVDPTPRASIPGSSVADR